jgi:diguanylate cyclase (GGDEF)-like protein/PAS domain S-box-containing protein
LRDLADLMEVWSDSLIQFDGSGFITYANAAACAAFGHGDESCDRQTHWTALLHSGRADCRARRIVSTLRRRDRWEGELTLRTTASTETSFHVLAVAHRDAVDGSFRCTALLRNVDDERRARQQIQRQADILRAITEAIPATVVVVDNEGRYRFANQAFERYCGLPREYILGRRPADVLGAEEVARRRPFMVRAYAGETVEFTLDYPGEHGTRWLSLTCVPLKVDGVVDGFVGISQDVTQHHREHNRLIHLAERDALTGLLNRAGFESSLERLAFADDAATLALLYIDLDHFKPVNDRHGHLAGDRLLQLFAQRLLGTVRTSDVVARLGGDEFAVLLAGIGEPTQALLVADKVLAAAREPFEVNGHAVDVSASVGIAIGVHPQAGWRDLVARADTLLYRAKSEGRGRAAA